MKSDRNDADPEKTFKQELEKRDIKAFIRLYKSYHEDLLILAYAQLDNRKLAIEFVQEFFEELWSKERFVTIEGSLYSHIAQKLKYFCESKRAGL